MMRAEFISMPRMTALVLAVLLAAGSLSGCSSMESEAAQMPAGEMQSSAISVQVTYCQLETEEIRRFVLVKDRIREESIFPLWNRAWIYLLIAGLILLEYWIRRRYGKLV